jgi:type IV secretion system protein VirB9
MTRLRLFPLALLLATAPSAFAAEGEPTLPLTAEPDASPPPVQSLLDLGPLPDEAANQDEPPVLARPDAAVFTYGTSIPRVTCLPYRACTILLAPDETILNLAIGDSERWQLENFSAPGTAPVVVFKPSAPNLLTNLVVKTDRRLYHLELLSPKPSATDPRNAELSYDALTTWTYPHRWAQTVAEPPRRPTPAAAPEDPSAPPVAASPADLHFAYRFDRPLWPAHRLSWTPDVVYDDGHKTFVHIPPGTHDLPAVLLVDENGEPSPIEATLTGPRRDWLLVPAVASRIRLVNRSGDKTRHLTLVRTR